MFSPPSLLVVNIWNVAPKHCGEWVTPPPTLILWGLPQSEVLCSSRCFHCNYSGGRETDTNTCKNVMELLKDCTVLLNNLSSPLACPDVILLEGNLRSVCEMLTVFFMQVMNLVVTCPVTWTWPCTSWSQQSLHRVFSGITHHSSRFWSSCVASVAGNFP